MTAAPRAYSGDVQDAPPGGVTIAKAAEPKGRLTTMESFDLGALTEHEYAAAMKRLELRKTRAEQIYKTILIPRVHYGVVPGAKQPSLYQAGADELATAFGLEVVRDEHSPDRVIETPEYTSVSVTRAIIDRGGRVLGRTTASCSTVEKRFKAKGGGWTYLDPRGALNDCHAMAEKRAKVRLVVGALGLAPWLTTEEDMERAMRGQAFVPWTREEKQAVAKAAIRKGIIPENATDAEFQPLKDLIDATMEGRKVGTGDDVQLILTAIDAWKQAAPSGDENDIDNDLFKDS